jgi:hypothetical protein
MLIVFSVTADLNNDALITPSGMAEFTDVGQKAWEPSAQLSAPYDTDYQVRLAFVQSARSPHRLAPRHG